MRISIDPRLDLGLSLNRAQQLQNRKNLPGGGEIALRQAADEFEALLVEQLVKEMRKAVVKSDLFGDRDNEELFEEMLDGEYVRLIMNRGGLGISDLLMKQWERDQPVNNAVGSLKFAHGVPIT